MTSHQTTPTATGPTSELVGLLAEFESPSQLIHACDQARQAGYTETDAYSPFPVHGIDPAIGIRRTRLPFFVLFVGINAALFAVFLQWYTNAASESPIWPGYDYIIGGKPYWSLPANIPVVFEITVLSSAFAVFFGMWGLNRLPQFSNPLFKIPRFKRVTSDRFFLAIYKKDGNFNRTRTEEQLNEWGAHAIEEIIQDLTDTEMPSWVKPVGVCGAVLMLLPPVMILAAQGMTSETPRLHFNPDMDWQYKSKTQTVSPRLEDSDGFLFADGRAMRPPVAGTIAQGELEDDTLYYQGIQEGTTPVSLTQDPAAPPEPAWTEAIPPHIVDEDGNVVQRGIEISEATLLEGQAKFNTYCSLCHGYSGDGDGLVSRRAMELSALGKAAWTPARNLHEETVTSQPVGRIFDTITNGRNTMSGYKAQISVEDRWKIVLYVKSLQNAEYSSMDSVPEDLRSNVPDAVRIGETQESGASATTPATSDTSNEQPTTVSPDENKDAPPVADPNAEKTDADSGAGNTDTSDDNSDDQ